MNLKPMNNKALLFTGYASFQFSIVYYLALIYILPFIKLVARVTYKSKINLPVPWIVQVTTFVETEWVSSVYFGCLHIVFTDSMEFKVSKN